MDLKKSSLVCQTWYISVRSHPYGKVTLYWAINLYLFLSRIHSNNNIQLGSLVREIHFGDSCRRGWVLRFPEDIAKVLYQFPNLQKIYTSGNEVLKELVINALSRLPKSSKRLRGLESIPELFGNKNYEIFLNKYRHSLTEVSLDSNQATFSFIQRFSSLNKLYLTEISCRSILFYSFLNAIPALQELSIAYPLNENHLHAPFPLNIYPAMRTLNLKFEIGNDFYHLQVIHLLSLFNNLQSLSMILTDVLNGYLWLDQLYAIEETISLINKLG
jgi:hypothetical protein